jgi:hypothetical protein
VHKEWVGEGKGCHMECWSGGEEGVTVRMFYFESYSIFN